MQKDTGVEDPALPVVVSRDARDEEDQYISRQVRFALCNVLTRSAPHTPGYLSLGIRAWVSHSTSRFTDISVDGLTVSGIDTLQRVVNPDQIFVVDRAVLRFRRASALDDNSQSLVDNHCTSQMYAIQEDVLWCFTWFPGCSLLLLQTILVMVMVLLVATMSLVVGIVAGNPQGTGGMVWSEIMWRWFTDPTSLHTCTLGS
jgi:hypothetical protein